MHKKALVKALKEKWIFGAGLDVYEHEPSIGKGLRGEVPSNCINLEAFKKKKKRRAPFMTELS